MLRNRVQQTEWWAFVRTSLLIPLSATLIVAAYNGVSQNLTSTAAADEAISLFARVSNTFAILFAVLYLLVNRMVNQLQMDLLSLLSFQAAEKAIPQHME